MNIFGRTVGALIWAFLSVRWSYISAALETSFLIRTDELVLLATCDANFTVISRHFLVKVKAVKSTSLFIGGDIIVTNTTEFISCRWVVKTCFNCAISQTFSDTKTLKSVIITTTSYTDIRISYWCKLTKIITWRSTSILIFVNITCLAACAIPRLNSWIISLWVILIAICNTAWSINWYILNWATTSSTDITHSWIQQTSLVATSHTPLVNIINEVTWTVGGAISPEDRLIIIW